MRHGRILVVLALIAPALAACATPQAMTVDSGSVVNANPKYRNAIAVRSVTGGRMMNVLTIMGVENEALKAALEIPVTSIAPTSLRTPSVSIPSRKK